MKKMTTKEAKEIVADALDNDSKKIRKLMKYITFTYGKKNWFSEWCDSKGVQKYTNTTLRQNVRDVYKSL
jgi:hypothetical protein